MQLVNGLKNYGIGANNLDLKKGQLVIIADACRNVHRDGLSFVPNPLLTKRGNPVGLQTDLFRATTFGAYSFQVNAVDGAEPYCLFSDVLCDALEGKAPEAIDNQFHPFRPVISNDALADYLDTEVPRRAAILKETMEPDVQAGIRLFHNYYDIFHELKADHIETEPHRRLQQEQEQQPQQRQQGTSSSADDSLDRTMPTRSVIDIPDVSLKFERNSSPTHPDDVRWQDFEEVARKFKKARNSRATLQRREKLDSNML